MGRIGRGADIKDGNISQFLLKPINFIGYRLSLFFSGRIIYAGVALVPVGIRRASIGNV